MTGSTEADPSICKAALETCVACYLWDAQLSTCCQTLDPWYALEINYNLPAKHVIRSYDVSFKAEGRQTSNESSRRERNRSRGFCVSLTCRMRVYWSFFCSNCCRLFSSSAKSFPSSKRPAIVICFLISDDRSCRIAVCSANSDLHAKARSRVEYSYCLSVWWQVPDNVICDVPSLTIL